MPNRTTRIVVSVQADDGSFDSSVSFPVAASEAERRSALELWAAMVQRALTALPATATEGESPNA